MEPLTPLEKKFNPKGFCFVFFCLQRNQKSEDRMDAENSDYSYMLKRQKDRLQ